MNAPHPTNAVADKLPNPRDLIERGAKNMQGLRKEVEWVKEYEAVVSIAISLKRIADRLEAITSVFSDDSGQLNVGADVNANVSL